MNNDQDRFCPTGDSERMPALLPGFVDTVFSEQQLWIGKHERRCGEVDPVLRQVGSIFVRIPFEQHRSIRVYIHITKEARLFRQGGDEGVHFAEDVGFVGVEDVVIGVGQAHDFCRGDGGFERLRLGFGNRVLF